MSDKDIDIRVEKVMEPILPMINNDDWNRETCEYILRIFAKQLLKEIDNGDTDE